MQSFLNTNVKKDIHTFAQSSNVFQSMSMSHLLTVVSKYVHSCSAKEWNEASANELKHHPYAPCCCFRNISDFFVPAVNAMLPTLRSSELFQTKLVPLVMKDKAVKMILGRSMLRLLFLINLGETIVLLFIQYGM